MTASPIGFDGARHGDAVRPVARQRSGGREFEGTLRFDDVVGETKSRQEAPEHGRRAVGNDESTSKGSRDLGFLHDGRRPSGQDAGLPAGSGGQHGGIDGDRTTDETPVAEDGGWRAGEGAVAFVSALPLSTASAKAEAVAGQTDAAAGVQARPASTTGSALSEAEGVLRRADQNSGFTAKAQGGKFVNTPTAADTPAAGRPAEIAAASSPLGAAGSARNGPIGDRNAPSPARASPPGDGSQATLSGNAPAALAQRAATSVPQARVSTRNADLRSQSSGIDTGRTASSAPAGGTAVADRTSVSSKQSFSGAVSVVRTDSTQADAFATPVRTVETTASETKAASKNASEHTGLIQSQSDQSRSVQSMTLSGILSKINADPAWTRALAPAGTAKPGAVPNAPTAANTLKLQLHPAHLGTVEATLRIDGDKLVIHLKVETAEAYKSLASGNDAILDKLKGHGYVVDQITVQHASADRPAASQQHASSQSFSQSQGGGEAMAGGGHRSDRQAGRGNPESRNASDEPPSAQPEPVSRPRPGGPRSDSVYL